RAGRVGGGGGGGVGGGGRGVEEAVDVEAVGEGGQVHPAVGDGGRAELGVVADGVAGRVLGAVPQLVRQIVGVEGAQDAAHHVDGRVGHRQVVPHDAGAGGVAVGREREDAARVAGRRLGGALGGGGGHEGAAGVLEGL